MPDSGDSLTVEVHDRIASVAAADWDACAGDHNPFTSHAFLLALEESGSATAEAGWMPQHLVASDSAGRILGVAPSYIKSHSYGEYVFDHGWAQAYQRAGGRYYPKLQIAVPFTPVPGRRLLLRDPADKATAGGLIAAMEQLAQELKLSSAHATFIAPDEVERFRAGGWMIRQGYQFHWDNRGYGSFDDFLATLSHSKRKAIRKERREVAEQGLEIEVLSGAAVEAEHWNAFFRLYIATGNRKWGSPYLTRDFFHRLGAALADRVVLVLARHEGRYVGGALNLRGRDTLYGRNWGGEESFKHLHFECCYYRAIDYAIAHGLARVEAGAQGEHKIQRGYLPAPTYSAHFIRDPGFAKAVADFLKRETAMIEHERTALASYSPFRHDAGRDAMPTIR